MTFITQIKNITSFMQTHRGHTKHGQGREKKKDPLKTTILAWRKKEIQQLPIQSICDDDCVLFLWVTFPCLEEGLELIRSWGFTYKTCGFTWVKRNKKSNTWFWGLGYWTRANAEICLIATKGKPKRVSKSVHQICDARIMEHSRKPDEIRGRIVQLCGDVPRIELFARQQAEGWDCWGNEV